MLKEAFGCCEGVSRCIEEVSGCVYLPAPEKTNRDAANHKFSILIAPFEEILGKTSSNEARINIIAIRRIKTQGFQDSTQWKNSNFTATAAYIYIIYILI